MRPGKTTHIFEIGDYSAKFSGNFDSGNLRNVLQVAPFHYELEAAYDSYEFPATNKTFFHFFVEGFPKGAHLTLVFKQLALLSSIKEYSFRYKPFKSLDGVNYNRLEDEQVEIEDNFQGYRLTMKVKSIEVKQYFSFALPYSYERYLNMVRDLPLSDKNMYIHKQVLCYSNNLNLVYAISITSHNRVTQQEEKIGEATNTILLPQKHLNPPKKYFDKPIILISSRVHPGETGASWAVEGILKFLTSQHEQAELIRNNFQVVVVPMLNPDGVEEGLYRLDTKGYNLNRYYLVSDNRQPSIYCMKHLIQHYHETKRLLYYFDLHGHPSQKGSFLYGNALDQLPFQVQTQMFARFMTLNCPTFQEKFCIFDREQMSSKDKHDQYTKQGCARVFAFKVANILHSYTIQHGFHGLSSKQSTITYSADEYYQEGRALLTSVLMTCGLKEPPEGYSLHSLRKQLAMEICNREGRFKKEEKYLSQKKQKVNEIVEKDYWRPIREQHFSSLNKTRQNSMTKKKFKVHKKQTISIPIQSFYSQDLKQQKQIMTETNQFTSIDSLCEQTRNKLQRTKIKFKLHRTNISAKSSSNTTKTDLDSPLPMERFMPKLAKIANKQTGRPLGSQPTVFKEKFRSLRRTGFQFSESRISGRDEEHIFGDTNLRAEVALAPEIRRNKIHSLFIETHV